MLVAALLRRDGIPQHALRGLRDLATGVVGEQDPGARDDRHLLVAQEHDIPRVRKDRRNVGGDEEFVLTQPHDNRRAVANRHDFLGILHRDQAHGCRNEHFCNES